MLFVLPEVKLAALILFCTLPASAVSQTTHEFTRDCASVGTLLKPFLRERGLSLHPQSCLDRECFTITAADLKDAKGKTVSGRRVNKDYTAATSKKGKHMPFGQWVSMDRSVQLQGEVELLPGKNACTVSLRFEFLTGGTLYVVVVPVDRDAALLKSDGKLEREYLDAIQQQLSSK